ncbi:MAG: hypothetical protein PHG07_07455 [Lachnospiraceae bacterium]|nr:hypothetical protein [Lachnospiraceae bacterium]
MLKLKTIEDKVKAVLTSQTDTRDDDMKLYLCVCRCCLPSIGAMPFETVMTQCRSLGIPCFESVRRTRQKLQAQNPELIGTARVKKLRTAQEQVYQQYAKG